MNFQYCIDYSRRELKHDAYYIESINVLKSNKILSYLDLGSNVGEFCNILFEEIPTLQEAHLIEVNSDLLLFSKTNVKTKNVYFYNVGISYLEKTYIIHDDALVTRLTEYSTNPIAENISTLENLNLPLVDLVKIDVEGMEYNIIENSSYLQKIKWLDIEFHRTSDYPTKTYVEKYFPNHEIVVIDKQRGGNCLLKLKTTK